MYRAERFALSGAKGLEQVHGAWVSDGFFRTLGVLPVLGRDFRPGEDPPTAPGTVLLSNASWLMRFAADKNIVGRMVTLDGDAYQSASTSLVSIKRTSRWKSSA